MCPQDNYPREFVKEKTVNPENGQKQGSVTLPQKVLPGVEIVDVYDLVTIDQILEHLRKAVTDKWAYKIEFGDKIVKGLGWIGTRETAAIIAKLSRGQHVIRSLKILRIQDMGDTWEAEVLAGLFLVWTDRETGQPRELMLNTTIGYHSQPKLGVRRDGSTWEINNPHKLALSKAQRNGMAALIPNKWVQTIVEVAEKEGKIADETEESRSTSGKSATDKQIYAIKTMLKHGDIDDATKDRYQEQVDAWEADHSAFTLTMASKAIKTLSAIVDAKKKDKKNGEPNGQGLL
jgi:hypothetical protein